MPCWSAPRRARRTSRRWLRRWVAGARPITFSLNVAARIKFGTDGWRGVVGDDFTYQTLRYAAQGVAEYLRDKGGDPLGIVGYDCRFASELFADEVARVLAGNGVKSLIFDRPSPTQVASWTVIHRRAAGAAVVTASHNP